MTDTVDLMIQARFDAVANSTDDRDWNDVLARAGLDADSIHDRRSMRRITFLRRVPIRVVLVAAVVVLAAVLTQSRWLAADSSSTSSTLRRLPQLSYNYFAATTTPRAAAE